MNDIEPRGQSFEDALSMLAELQYEYDRIGKVISTKNPDSPRKACDDEMRLRYELSGVRSIDVKIGDSVVGRFSAVIAKEEPEKRCRRPRVSREAAMGWIMGEDMRGSHYFASLADEAVRLAEDYMLLEGEQIPGAEIVEVVEPARPGYFKNTMLKVDREGMEKALEAREASRLEVDGGKALAEASGRPDGPESA